MWLPRSLCKDTLLSLQHYYKVSLYELSIVSLSLLGVRVLVIEAVRNLLQKPSSVVIPEAKSLHLAGSSSILVFQHLHEHRCGDQHFCSAQTAAAPMKEPRAEGARVLGSTNANSVPLAKLSFSRVHVAAVNPHLHPATATPSQTLQCWERPGKGHQGRGK